MDGCWVELENEGKAIKKSEYTKLDRQYDDAVKRLPSNVRQLPAPQPKPQAAPDYDYAVYTSQQRQFTSGMGMVLTLQDPKGNNVEVFMQHTDGKLKPGTCLKNVKLSVLQNGGNSFNIMDAYQVA
jgi:hypothetical protein